MENNNHIDELLSVFDKYMSSAELLKTELEVKISSAIVKKRLELNMSQKEFSQYLGVSQGLVSRWESKNHNFTINTIAEVFDKLGINIEIIIGNESEKKSFSGFWADSSLQCEKSGKYYKDFYIYYNNEKESSAANWRSNIDSSTKVLNTYTQVSNN